MITRSVRPARALGLAAVLLLLPACSDSGMKPTFPVAGQVLYQGQPAKGAVVSFHPLGDNAQAKPRILPNADCDADGRFALSTYNQHDGAPTGEYAVTVFWPGPKGKRQAEDEGDEEERGEEKNQLPALYGNKDSTPLRFTVKPGDNPSADFDIK